MKYLLLASTLVVGCLPTSGKVCAPISVPCAQMIAMAQTETELAIISAECLDLQSRQIKACK